MIKPMTAQQISFAVMLGLIVTVGCWSRPTQPQGSSSEGEKPSDSSDKSQLNRDREIVAGWPTPQVCFVLTGEQHGYLEPCGCSETQSGGISRRADLFRQLRDEKQWQVIGLDVGDTMKRSRRQDQIKFGILYQALVEMGYRALALGPSDLKLQVDHLYSLVPNSTDPEQPLPFVAANVIFYGSPDIGTPTAVRVIEVNGVKIGITGFLGESAASSIFPGGNNTSSELLTIQPAIPAVQRALETLKAENCQLLILLGQGTKEEVEAVLQANPELHVCLSGAGPEDPAGIVQKVGDTILLESGRKGKFAGVLGYYPEDSEQKFRYELIDLDKDRFQRTEAMENQMAFYQEMLKQEKIIAAEPAVPHPAGQSFVGAAKCGECHTKAYAHWKTTKHSHATETLISGSKKYQETEWINRVHDPECISCHAVGWEPQEVFRFESGFISLEQTPHLTGQGCENCHGPGSKHTELEEIFLKTRNNSPEIQQARAEIKVDLARAEKEVCRKCHDFENSPGFDFVKYWAKVVHRGKD